MPNDVKPSKTRTVLETDTLHVEYLVKTMSQQLQAYCSTNDLSPAVALTALASVLVDLTEAYWAPERGVSDRARLQAIDDLLSGEAPT